MEQNYCQSSFPSFPNEPHKIPLKAVEKASGVHRSIVETDNRSAGDPQSAIESIKTMSAVERSFVTFSGFLLRGRADCATKWSGARIKDSVRSRWIAKIPVPPHLASYSPGVLDGFRFPLPPVRRSSAKQMSQRLVSRQQARDTYATSAIKL